jgi:hypothetical protein
VARAVRSQLEASSTGLGTEAGVSRTTPFVPKKAKNGHGGGPGSLDMRILLQAMQAMRNGDFSVRLPNDLDGLSGKVADVFNEIVSANERMAQQLEFVGQAVGRQGRTRQRLKLGVPGGAWSGMETSVNSLIDDLLWLNNAVTRSIAAVARGDLMQTVPLEADGRPLEGEFLTSATIVNTMVSQLSVFTS